MNTSIYSQLISLNKKHTEHYLRRYAKLISFYKQRNLKKVKGLHHEHHIVPKAFGGLDKKENLVCITPREHFILHHLLYKAFPNSEMVIAFFGMCNKWSQMGFKVTSKVYEKSMIEFAERQRNAMINSYKNGSRKCFFLSELYVNPNLKRPDGSSAAQDKVKNGSHPFQKRKDGSSVGQDRFRKRFEEGTFNFQKRPDGSSLASDRVENGTNPFLKENQIQIECPHCKRTFDEGNYNQWHGDKCKLNPLYKEETKIECPHCNKEFCSKMFAKYHDDKCKLNPLFKPESKILCEHCNKEFGRRNFNRWHGYNCKLKPQI